jgi:hypothetical protein
VSVRLAGVKLMHHNGISYGGGYVRSWSWVRVCEVLELGHSWQDRRHPVYAEIAQGTQVTNLEAIWGHP